MKTLLHKVISTPLLSTLFLSLALSQLLVLPLLADDPVNITDVKGCRVIEGESERLACYDTVSGGGVFNEQKLKEVQDLLNDRPRKRLNWYTPHEIFSKLLH